MPLSWLSASFQSLSLLPASKLGFSGANSQMGGLVNIPGSCGSLQGTLLWGWEFLLMLQPPEIFTVRGFEALFPHIGTLDCVICLTSQFFLLVYLHVNVGPPSLPAASLPSLVLQPLPCPPQLHQLPRVISSLAAHLRPSYWSGECFFINSSVVRLPYSSIFWQFWLFFVFKFIVVLLSVVWGGKVYLPMPPSWLEVPSIFLIPSLIRFISLSWFL